MAVKRVVYVSSTFVDLERHRATLKAELERAGFDVESMERYPAFEQRPLDRCIDDVRRCDAYVLILAHRYGFVPPADDGRALSITQREYEAAMQAARPCFVFCVDAAHDGPPSLKDTPRSRAGRRVAAFRRDVVARHGSRTFTDPDNLTKQVLSALAAHAERRGGFTWPQPWDFAACLADKREAFGGRDWLLADIATWQAAGQPRALLVRADFGVGKTASATPRSPWSPARSCSASPRSWPRRYPPTARWSSRSPARSSASRLPQSMPAALSKGRYWHR